jgi:hypothetical protein
VPMKLASLGLAYATSCFPAGVSSRAITTAVSMSGCSCHNNNHASCWHHGLLLARAMMRSHLEGHLDLARLDAEAVDLDLVVGAADVLERAPVRLQL